MPGSFILRLVIFLIINFGALGLGGLFTNSGVTSDWYQNLNKAPWTPPGWVFGAAWTTIMVCFSIFMSYATKNMPLNSGFMMIFVFQLVLNILWNPMFFYFQLTDISLAIIILLLLAVVYLFYIKFPNLQLKSLLIAPYIIWLIIATSLNAYVVVQN